MMTQQAILKEVEKLRSQIESLLQRYPTAPQAKPEQADLDQREVLILMRYYMDVNGWTFKTTTDILLELGIPENQQSPKFRGQLRQILEGANYKYAPTWYKGKSTRFWRRQWDFSEGLGRMLPDGLD